MIDGDLIKQWARSGMRGTLGWYFYEKATDDDRLMLVSADLGNTSGLSKFMSDFPQQFLNVGIAEQNMIGVATGLTLKGYKTFATSFAPFATARCCEQIKVNLGEMRVPVNVVGIASGFEMEYFGNSHYGYDDIASMRSISGLNIICPADTTELVKVLDKLMQYDQPTYLRLTKMKRKAVVYNSDFDYEIGKANLLYPVGEVTIIATGSVVYTAMKVADRLKQDCDITCGVVDMHTVKPVDKDIVRKACGKSTLIVTLEEHNVIGGLGSAVAEVIAAYGSQTKQLFIGVSDLHTHVGDYDYVMKAYGLDEESVFEKITAELDDRICEDI